MRHSKPSRPENEEGKRHGEGSYWSLPVMKMISKGIRHRNCNILRYLSIAICLEVDNLGNLRP